MLVITAIGNGVCIQSGIAVLCLLDDREGSRPFRDMLSWPELSCINLAWLMVRRMVRRRTCNNSISRVSSSEGTWSKTRPEGKRLFEGLKSPRGQQQYEWCPLCSAVYLLNVMHLACIRMKGKNQGGIRASG